VSSGQIGAIEITLLKKYQAFSRAWIFRQALSHDDLAQPANPAQDPVDFSHYEPKPPPGTIEVWLPSRS